jgi:hypothetical protein
MAKAQKKRVFIPAAEVIAEKDAAILAEREMTDAAPQSLASFGRAIFERARDARQTVETEMIDLRRRLAGEYTPEVLAALKAAGMPPVFFRLSSRKSRDVSGWLGEVFNQYQDRTWDIVPENIPEVPPEQQQIIQEHVWQASLQIPEVQALFVQAQQTMQPVDINQVRQIIQSHAEEIKAQAEQEARHFVEKRCTRLEKKIDDALTESGYYEALRECINDLSELKICCMKGPILRREKVLDGFDEQGKPKVTDKVVRKFYRVSPFDAYPSPGAKSFQDGPFVELEHFRPVDLQKMIGVPGYNEDAIRRILNIYGPTGYTEMLQISQTRYQLEKQSMNGFSDANAEMIDSLDVWAPIPGQLLLDWGMSKKDVPDPDISYPCNIKIVNNIVWRAVLNPDPLEEIPYDGTSFLKSNDSVWGTAPCELGAEVEDMALNALRHINRNISESAGPMAMVNEDMLAEGEEPDRWPGKTFVTTSKGMQSGDAVKYLQANLLASELWALYEKTKLELDSIIVPSFGQGSSLTKGGGKTASGLSMIAAAESRNLKVVVANVDLDIQLKKVERIYRSIMLFDDDMSLKGGLHLKPRGVTAQLIKENVIVRQLEYVKGAMNPVDLQIHTIKGLAYMKRDIIKNLGWNVDEAMPNYERLEASKPEPLPAPAAQQGQDAGAQAAQQAAPAQLDASGKPAAEYHQ